MRKEDLIRLHALLFQMRRTFEENAVQGHVPRSYFDAYDRLGVTPVSLHRDRRSHQAAVFLLGEALSRAAADLGIPAMGQAIVDFPTSRAAFAHHAAQTRAAPAPGPSGPAHILDGSAQTPGDPVLDEIDELAFRLLGKESKLDIRVLRSLLARPARYGELRPLLEGIGDNALTMTLRRLAKEGLVDRRTDASRKPVVHLHEITPLGVEVILRIETLLESEHETASAYL